MLMLLYDFLNLVVSGVKLCTVTGPYSSGEKEVESFALLPLDCVEHKMHQWTVVLCHFLKINKH